MSERVRLMHVVTVPQTFGFLRGQVSHMHAHGFDVAGVSSAGPYQERFAREEPVELHTVAMPRAITPHRDLVAVWRLVRIMRRVKPTIVHAHTPKGGLLGMIAAWIARTPVRIYHIRGLPLTAAAGNRKRLLTLTERVACALSHRVLCVSHSIREVAIAEGLCAPEKIVTPLGGTGNGVDARGRFDPDQPAGDRDARRARIRDEHGIPADAPVVAFVGRLVRDKGIVELTDAWQRVRQEVPDAHLLVAGPWEPQDPVPPHVRTLLEEDARVHLMGETDDVRSVYAAADLVTLPTYREGFPNVPLEAAAMRLPVVATRVPGCVDAVADGETGTLVPARDAQSLGEALTRYLRDPALRKRHGEAGRERVLRDFARERIWEAIQQEYEQLLRARRVTA